MPISLWPRQQIGCFTTLQRVALFPRSAHVLDPASYPNTVPSFVRWRGPTAFESAPTPHPSPGTTSRKCGDSRGSDAGHAGDAVSLGIKAGRIHRIPRPGQDDRGAGWLKQNPDSYRLVFTRRDRATAVRRKGDGIDNVSMTG